MVHGVPIPGFSTGFLTWWCFILHSLNYSWKWSSPPAVWYLEHGWTWSSKRPCHPRNHDYSTECQRWDPRPLPMKFRSLHMRVHEGLGIWILSCWPKPRTVWHARYIKYIKNKYFPRKFFSPSSAILVITPVASSCHVLRLMIICFRYYIKYTVSLVTAFYRRQPTWTETLTHLTLTSKLSHSKIKH